MKRLFFVVVSSLFCLMFMACNSDKQAIIKSAYGYLDAMGNYRIAEAAPYATMETQEQTLKYVSEVIMPVTDTNYIKSNTPANIEIVKVQFKNDTVANVLYTKRTPIKTQEGTLEMRKCDDQWLAHVIICNPIMQPKTLSPEKIDSISKTMKALPRSSGDLHPISKKDISK